MAERMNSSFIIPLNELEERLGASLNGSCPQYNRVVSIRDFIAVHDISFLKEEVVNAMIRKVPLRGSNVFPYQAAKIKVFRTEPYGFDIGQTFILRDKLIKIMEDLEDKLLSGFPVRGFSQLPPLKLYGEDSTGKAIGFYFPPLIEHNPSPALIDGIHRSYICSSSGTAINAIHVYGASSPLPFDPISWRETSLTSEKPPKNERYKNLMPELFRDLSAVGIDG